jgi:hypothetical protein
MDNVSELAARATSYILLLQDALALGPLVPNGPVHTICTLNPAAATEPVQLLCDQLWLVEPLRTKAVALVESTSGLAVGGTAGMAANKRIAFGKQATELLVLVQRHLTPAALRPLKRATPPRPRLFPFRSLAQPLTPFLRLLPRPAAAPGPAVPLPLRAAPAPAPVPAPTLAPEIWRRALQEVLYTDASARVALASALDYLPMQVYALLGAPPPYVQQKWDTYLCMTSEQLDEELQQAGLPANFELIFGRELCEITNRRQALKIASPPAATPPHPSPLAHAKHLELCALALSGGGIRTATFNLGLLQGLASAGWLPRFDYLSTVSGGGYLGAWLTAWIQREGAQAKVAARLCPTSSPLPQADEVRPIRWLRMYSNYLAPKGGAFATDTWTMATTWLRNTLLNQLIIVLALGAVLALGSAALYGWFLLRWQPTTTHGAWWVAGVGLVLLGPATWLASSGMRMFWVKLTPEDLGRMQGAKWGMQFLALAGAYVASGFFFQAPYPGFGTGCGYLWPAAALSTVGLLAMAWRGRYDRCFYRRPSPDGVPRRYRILAWSLLLLVSLVAAGAGLLLLVLAWKLLYTWHEAALLPTLQNVWATFQLRVLHTTVPGTPWPYFAPGLTTQLPRPVAEGWAAFKPQAQLYGAFILGVPLVLEAVVLAVITRMALLGRNFPDERREWWGRMGAILHRAMVVWMLFASSPLLMRGTARLFAQLFGHNMEGLSAALATGGWLALVGKAVQLAFSARTRAVDTQQATVSWLDRVLSFAPYLFGIGLLVLVQGAVYWLLHYVALPGFSSPDNSSAAGLAGRSLALAGVLAGAALALGWRVGVNEFSLHHFYRNRLVRAYLGASRSRFARESSANPFTGFDRDDDVKLWKLRRTPLRPAAGTAPPPPPCPCHPPPKASPTLVYDGPYLIINATLNATKVVDLAQQDRQAESFVFTPLYCGFDFARIRALDPTRPIYSYGYRPTEHYAYAKDQGPGVGTAMAISGAAANPNEGYHSSPTTAFLLTLFNVRLGWWMGNPRHDAAWKKSDPRLGLLYVLKDLLGRSTTSDQFVNLSDGGHFDNMGLYELVRRRCRYIVLGDGEEDHLFTCDGLANAIRRCRVDFGVEIKLDVSRITTRPAGYSQAHYAVGTIHYPDDMPGQPRGRILYVKSSLTNDEPTDVREYAQYNSAFPHQSTGDQFFNEAQFESYRRLGLHIFETLRRDNPLLADPTARLDSIFRGFKKPT